MISCLDLFHKNSLKSKGTLNVKFKQIHTYLSFSDVGFFLGKEPFRTDFGDVNVHPV